MSPGTPRIQFTADNHAVPVDQADGAVRGESVRADPVGATWSATPHASHSRRALLKHGLQASILIGGWPSIDRPAAIRNAWSGTRFAPAREPSTTTLVLATNRAPSDLDPHSAYDPGSQIALQGPFEGLIQLRPGTADSFVPMLAESWTANADKSVWTFHLRPGVDVPGWDASRRRGGAGVV